MQILCFSQMKCAPEYDGHPNFKGYIKKVPVQAYIFFPF